MSLCAPRVQKLNLKGLAERSERMGILLRDELATLPSSIVKQVPKDISMETLLWRGGFDLCPDMDHCDHCAIVQVRGKGLLNAIVISPEFSATEVYIQCILSILYYTYILYIIIFIFTIHRLDNKFGGQWIWWSVLIFES